MSTLAGRICSIAEDLKRVLAGDLGAVESPEFVMDVLQEVSTLDTVSWHDLIRDLDSQAPEMRHTMDEIKAKVDVEAIRLRIGTVGQRPVVVDGNGRVLVDLELYSFGGPRYRSRADLEDTLWIGMSIMKAVVASIESAGQMLNLSTMRKNVGEVFLRNLTDAEEQIRRVRELYGEITRDDQ